jgi:hypothetical protein
VFVTKKTKAEKGRFSSRKKSEAVLRLLRGEELDALSRELGVTAATLSSWREAFLAAGQSSLKSRETNAEQDELRRLKEALVDQIMRNEVLREGLRLHGERDPLASGKSRR